MIKVRVVAILTDNNGNTLGARLDNGISQRDVTTDFLKNKAHELDVENAIIDVRGYVKSKRGYPSLERVQKIESLVLYHGSPNNILTPKYGLGMDKHDYGKGLYLTPNMELAKEWAVCGDNEGYLYRIDIDVSGLEIFDFTKESPLSWLAELMSHRDADSSVRYKRFAPIFIKKYKKDTSGYDIIRGVRADSSYFSIAKRFVRDEIDVSILNEALSLGDLGIQYCIKSSRAFRRLNKIYKPVYAVPREEYLAKYNRRDSRARDDLRNLIKSDKNTMMETFSSLIKGDTDERGFVSK